MRNLPWTTLARADTAAGVDETRPVPLVIASDLSRAYQRGTTRVVAVTSATCTIQPGDRIAIVGQSGSGKSTLLHLLGGLDEPSSGSICWPALGLRAILRPTRVAYVFQAPSLLPALSVLENVELPLLLSDVDAEVARARAWAALDSLHLRDLAERLPEEVSGGQAQRVALARGLAHRPSLLLADEPTGQLDQPTAALVLDALLSALDGTPTALVIATHDASVSRRMARLWHMQRGTLSEARPC